MKEVYTAEKRKIQLLRTSIIIYVSMLAVISFGLFNITEKFIVLNPMITQSTQILCAFVKACAITFGIAAVMIPLKMRFLLLLNLAKIGAGENEKLAELFENPDDFYSSVHSDSKRIKLAETVALYLSTKKSGETLEAISPYAEAAYFFSYIALFSITSNSVFVFMGMITTAVIHTVFSKLSCAYEDTQIDEVLKGLFDSATNLIKNKERR